MLVVTVQSVVAYTTQRAIPFRNEPTIHMAHPAMSKKEMEAQYRMMVAQRLAEGPVLYWWMTVIIDGTQYAFYFDRRHLEVWDWQPYVLTNVGPIPFP